MKFGNIKNFIYKNSSQFALPTLSSNDVILTFLLRKDTIRTILQMTESQPVSITQLMAQVKETYKKIGYCIERLQEFAIIEKCAQEDASASNLYGINPQQKPLYLKIRQDLFTKESGFATD
ncbi:MAG: hypothetical protein RBG13Loki_4307 [Promethearchaeota archaeon CR_4]|nr:MAG: hypothetical protein RBG13Loki_4307 [Candidatus Lokiarchaeota archaeon CR_4]